MTTYNSYLIVCSPIAVAIIVRQTTWTVHIIVYSVMKPDGDFPLLRYSARLSAVEQPEWGMSIVSKFSIPPPYNCTAYRFIPSHIDRYPILIFRVHYHFLLFFPTLTLVSQVSAHRLPNLCRSLDPKVPMANETRIYK
jgi:hypothetical protein